MILSGALNFRQMRGREEANRAALEQAAAKEKRIMTQQEYLNRFNEIKYNTALSQDARDAQLAQLKFEFDRANSAMNTRIAAERLRGQQAERGRKAEAITYGTAYEKDGKMYRDILIGGSVVGAEELGAPSASKAGRWFQSPDGSETRFISNSTGIAPAGWGAVADPGIAEERAGRIQDRNARRDEKLAGWELNIQTGEDASGISLDDEVIDQYVSLYNKQSPDMTFVKREVPGVLYGTNEKWVKIPIPIPQTDAEFEALEEGDYYIDPDDGLKYIK